MNFDFNERERAYREKIKALFDSDSKATLAQLETGDPQRARKVLLQWLNNLAKAGYLTLDLEGGKNSAFLVGVQQDLATISPSLFLSVEVTARIFGRLIAVFGTLNQKREILSPLKEGRLIGTVAILEENTSIESNPLNTCGSSVGKSFLVSGHKSHVVNGPVADWIAVAGKVQENSAFFLIKKDSKGLSIGKRLLTLGFNGATTCVISLKDCIIHSKYLMGPFEKEEPLQIVRTWENQILVAGSLGLMQRCYDAALAYAKDHKSGGKPIIAYQEVSFKFAEMRTLLETSQLLAYRAAWMAEIGEREASCLFQCAKVFCTESAEYIASQALQILGVHGYLYGNPAEEGYRDAKYLQIAGTSSEIARMKIGEELLERY